MNRRYNSMHDVVAIAGINRLSHDPSIEWIYCGPSQRACLTGKFTHPPLTQVVPFQWRVRALQYPPHHSASVNVESTVPVVKPSSWQARFTDAWSFWVR